MASITDLPDVANKLVLEFLADPDRLNKNDDIVFLYNLLFVNTCFYRIIVDTNNNNLYWILLSSWTARKFFQDTNFDDTSNLEGMVKAKTALSKKITGLNNTSKFYELLSFQIASINKSYLNLYAVRNNKKLMLALIWLDVKFFKEASVELKQDKDFMVKSASMHIGIASSFGDKSLGISLNDQVDLLVDSLVGFLSIERCLPFFSDYLVIRRQLSNSLARFGDRDKRIVTRLKKLYDNASVNSSTRYAVSFVLSSMMRILDLKDHVQNTEALKYIEYDINFLQYILDGYNEGGRLELLISVLDFELRSKTYIKTYSLSSIAIIYSEIIKKKYTIAMNKCLIQLASIVSSALLSLNDELLLNYRADLVRLLSSIMQLEVLKFYIGSKQSEPSGYIGEFIAFIQPIVNFKDISINMVKELLMAMCICNEPIDNLEQVYDVIPDNMLAVAMMYCSDGDSFNEWIFNRCSFADEVLLSSNTYSSNIMVRTCVYLLTNRVEYFHELGDDYFGHIVVEAYKLMNGAEDDGDYSLSTMLFDCFKEKEEKLKQLLSHKMEGRNVLLHIAFELSRDSSITVSSVSAFDALIECVKDITWVIHC